MNPYLNIATQSVRLGAKQLLQSMDRIDRLEITEKSTHDFVSTADLLSERVIIENLQKYYPDIPILSEEHGLIKAKDTEYMWILDPLDGTTNFLKGIPHFAISLALTQNDKTVLSVVYDPVKDELFSASKGQGAYCNNNRIRVKNNIKLQHAYIGLGGPKYHMQEHQQAHHNMTVDLMLHSLSTRRLGSASLDICYLAAGRFDAYWGVLLNKWDIAAAELIAREAGAIVADFSGNASNIPQEILIAPPKLLHELLTIIEKHN